MGLIFTFGSHRRTICAHLDDACLIDAYTHPWWWRMISTPHKTNQYIERREIGLLRPLLCAYCCAAHLYVYSSLTIILVEWKNRQSLVSRFFGRICKFAHRVARRDIPLNNVFVCVCLYMHSRFTNMFCIQIKQQTRGAVRRGTGLGDLWHLTHHVN